MDKTKTIKKAPKAPADPQKKLLITAMKKTINTNTTLPILEDVLFFPDCAIVTDLETFVSIPYKMPGVPKEGICIPGKMFQDILDIAAGVPSVSVDKDFGVEFADGARKMKVMGENPDNYPKMPDGEFKLIGSFGPERIEDLKTALCFVSNDDLRPAMTGVFLGKEICATDAHRLFWKAIEPLAAEFILPDKSAKILLALGGQKWDIYHNGDAHVRFVNEAGVVVLFRTIDARFPDYKVVIPDLKEVVAEVVAAPELLLKEIKNAGKFANRSTKQVCFTLNGELSIASQDIDFSFEYTNVLKDAQFSFVKTYKQFILPADKDRDEMRVVTAPPKKGKHYVQPAAGGNSFEIADPVLLQPTDPIMSIAFNGDFLTEIISKIPKGEKVTMKIWGPTKAAIINDHYLVMSLMMNS